MTNYARMEEKKMFDFLSSEVWWMETIISALITGAVAVVGYFFMYNHNLKSMAKDIRDTIEQNKGLAEDHKGLSDEHKALSKEQALMAKDVSAIVSATSYLKDESLKEQNSRGALNRRELDLHDIMLQLADMIKENRELQTKNKELAANINALQQENAELKAAIRSLQEEKENGPEL